MHDSLLHVMQKNLTLYEKRPHSYICPYLKKKSNTYKKDKPNQAYDKFSNISSC